MRVWPILLRLLLSLVLLFNGATAAMAVSPMNHGSMTTIAKAAPVVITEAKTPPCHQHGQDAPALASQPEKATPSPWSPDCCKSGACQCACMHQAQAAIPVILFAPLPVMHTASVRPMPAGHASPALPHLIRPPIG